MADTSGVLPAFAPPVREGTSEGQVVTAFLVGYAVLWVTLTAMTESPRTSGLAAALASAVAVSATVLYAATAAENLGISASGGSA